MTPISYPSIVKVLFSFTLTLENKTEVEKLPDWDQWYLDIEFNGDSTINRIFNQNLIEKINKN